MAIDKAKLLKVADKHIAKQNYSKALNELLKVLKVSPGDVNLLNKVGDLYSKLGKTMHAIEHFLKVGDSYQKSGFALKAIALYKKIIRLDPKYMDARHRLVDLYMQQGYNSETKGELRMMAEHYYGENLFPRALECYEKMVEIDPNNLDARIKISEILVREGKREEACEHFVAMARDLLDKTMINEAKKIIGQGLKILPTHPGLLLLNCHTQLAEGKVEEALRQLKEVVSQDPHNPEALSLLAQTYLKRSQFEEARDLYLKLYTQDPSNTAALESLSTSFIANNQLDQAFACLEPVGEFFLKEGNFEEATRLIRTILYVDEDHLGAQKLLIRIYIAANQKPNALLSLEKVIHSYLDQGDKAQAETYINQLLEIDPTNQEWRDKLHTMSRGANPPTATTSMEEDEIHVFDERSLESASVDESSIAMELNDSAAIDDQDDDETRLANHLTEAQVFVKYNMIDKALEHLEKAKDIDFLHVGVNTNLKNLYIKKGDVNKAIPCMVSLVNAALEDQDYERANHIIDELEAYNSEIAAIHRSRVESMSGPSPSHHAAPAEKDFHLDFGDGGGNEGLVFNNQPDDQDVVDFSAMGPDLGDLDSTALEGSAWSLDMDNSLLDANGSAQDFNDLYDPAKVSDKLSGAHDLPSLAELGDDSRLDLSIPEELIEQKDEPAGALGFDGDPHINLDASIGGTLPEPIEALTDLDIELGDEPPKQIEEERTHAPLGGAQGSLASELEEIDFFISVEAYEDARNLINDARRNFGEHPLLMEREHELAAKTQDMAQAKAAMSEAPAPGSKGPKEETPTGFFDLASELNEEFFAEDVEEEGPHEVNDATSQEEIQSVEELFEEFKKGVDEQIDDEDHETHYDLGIAYKEMGLLDEAINEFKRASRDTTKFLECATMIGNCLIELGRMDEAVSHYEAHLASPGLDEANDLALRYELALAFQRYGELEKALDYLKEIQGRQADYRDVAGLIEALE